MKLARLLALPALLWFSFFIFIPLAIVFAISFGQRGTYGGIDAVFTLQNYLELFTPQMGLIIWDSLRLATLTALSCTAIGVLVAWAMAAAPPAQRRLWLALIALPFLTNLIIRVYAIKLFVGASGPVQWSLTQMGFAFDPFVFTANPSLVWYGMLTSYLPFAVLPLYGAFEKFDFTLVEAAQDLGAGPGRILFHVILPNLRAALAGAFLLVFIPCLGEYVIPDLLGGAKTMLLGNLISEQFLKARDWPFGSAVAIYLILVLALALWIQRRFSSRALSRGGGHE